MLLVLVCYVLLMLVSWLRGGVKVCGDGGWMVGAVMDEVMRWDGM